MEKWPLTYCSRLVEDEQFFRTKEVAGEANSETRIEMIENSGQLGLYQLQPVTGRKHQLRVHMMALGLPILNDGLYPNLTPEGQIDHAKLRSKTSLLWVGILAPWAVQ